MCWDVGDNTQAKIDKRRFKARSRVLFKRRSSFLHKMLSVRGADGVALTWGIQPPDIPLPCCPGGLVQGSKQPFA